MSNVRIPIKHTHSLSKHGYSTKASTPRRRAALLEAVREEEALKGSLRKAFAYVIHKLSALGTLSKRTNPRASVTFKANMRWVRKQRNARTTKTPRRKNIRQF